MTTSNLPVPEWFDAKSIFAKLHEGKTSDQIAKELGVKRAELVREMKKHPEDFREIRAALQYIRLEDAHDEIDAAAEAGDITKARAAEIKAKSAQWELERVYRQVYGEQKEAPVNPVQIVIGLRREVVIAGIDDDSPEQPKAEIVKGEDAKIIEEQPKPAPIAAPTAAPDVAPAQAPEEKPKAKKKKPIENRSVLGISAPVPPSPKEADKQLDYGKSSFA